MRDGLWLDRVQTITKIGGTPIVNGRKALSVAPRTFAPGVLESVRALGGQFADVLLTTVLAGETLKAQRDRQVIKFCTDWHFKPDWSEGLTVGPTVGSEVIYLPKLVEGSFGCTYASSVQGILGKLPTIKGLHWLIGNTPTYCRVLANHLQGAEEYLLPDVYTWTTDTYKSSEYNGPLSLLVGLFGSSGVFVHRYHPDRWNDPIGLFVLGIPV